MKNNTQQTQEKALIKARTQKAHRALALQILYAIDRSGYKEENLEEFLRSFSLNYNISISSNDFSLQIVTGVLSKRSEFEKKISALSKNWKTNRIGCLTKLIIEMAMWEISYKINPGKVVIDQAVELAKSFCEKDSYRFVNGLLDKFLTQYFPEEKQKSPQKSINQVNS